MAALTLVKHHDGMAGAFDLHYAARTSIDKRSSSVLEHLARITKQLSIEGGPESTVYRCIVGGGSPTGVASGQQQHRLSSTSPIRSMVGSDNARENNGRSGGGGVYDASRGAAAGGAPSPLARLPQAEVALLRLRDEAAVLEAQLEHLKGMGKDKDARLIAAKQQLLQAQDATASFLVTQQQQQQQQQQQSSPRSRYAPRSSSATSSSLPTWQEGALATSSSSSSSNGGTVLELGKQYLRHEESIRLLENAILETQSTLERMVQQLSADDSEFTHAERRKDRALADLATANAASADLDEQLAGLQAQAAQRAAERRSLEEQLELLTLPSLDANSVAQLEKRRNDLEVLVADAEGEIKQLKACDSDLQQSIAQGAQHAFTIEFGNLSLEVSTAMRRLHRIREAMMLLKAFLINLCEDVDVIAETVQSIRDDPNFAAFSPFTEPSNAWRRNLLSAAYAEVVALMRTQQHLTDLVAANALLARTKRFVIVYDLFSNHFDAVVAAVMASDGVDGMDAMWSSVLEMQHAADQCVNTLTESRKVQARRRSSVVSLTTRRPTITGFSKGPLGN